MLVLVLLAPGCAGGGGGEDAGWADDGDAGGADPGFGDDAGTAGDDGSGGDPGEDAGADAGVDAGAGELDGADAGEPMPCELDGTLPGWVTRVGDTAGFELQDGLLRLRVEVIDAGILRLVYLHGDQAMPARPSWVVIEPPPYAGPLGYGTVDDLFVVCTPRLRLEARPDGCLLRVVDRQDGTELLADPDDGGYVPVAAPGAAIVRATPPGEHFYGLGEKTGPLDRSGRRFVLYNTDPYDDEVQGYPPDADPLYQSIPFLIGLRGTTAYGLYTDNTHRSVFDLAASEPARVRIDVAGGLVDQYLIAGPSMREVLGAYTRLTGRMPMPPRWALGYHQSRWGYWPDERVREVAREFRERQIPADAVWLDIQHMDGFRSFTWDPAGFGDPAGLVEDLRASGFATVVIVDPGIKVDPAWDVYQTGLDADVFLNNPDGTPYVGQVWPGEAVFPDFTSPAARTWWSGLVPRITSHGVSGIWLDMNEPASFIAEDGHTVPDSLAAHGDGVATTMAEVHNVYALLEARATHHTLQQAHPGVRPFMLTRAGFAGIQRYAAVWTGDVPSTFPSLRGTLPMLLGLGLSGVPFAGSDVGGYSGTATPELFARWMALGSISPFFRGHCMQDGNDQEPWMFGVEVEAINRAFIERRYRLLPTLYSLFHEAHASGSPVLRPLVFEFQQDPAVHTIDDEVMLGRWLLYAPVCQPGATSRTVVLPAGRWFELLSGAVVEGPASVTHDVTLAALPAYVREGAILVRGPALQWSGQAPAAPLELEIYPSEQTTTQVLYEDDGRTNGYEQNAYARLVYTLQRTPTGAVLAAGTRQGDWTPPARTMLVRLRRADHGVQQVALDGELLEGHGSYQELLDAGRGVWYDQRDRSIVAAFADRDDFTLVFDYDPSIEEPAPEVEVVFRVRVPPGTPPEPPVHIATSASGWTQQPLAWSEEPDVAEGLVALPRGEWFEYKYTRGGWDTVEKWNGCVEAQNRYGLAAAHPVRQDTVETWADWCP